eukprot:scaffold82322_cov66-Phaeocystis_antarctica.AAC.8
MPILAHLPSTAPNASSHARIAGAAIFSIPKPDQRAGLLYLNFCQLIAPQPRIPFPKVTSGMGANFTASRRPRAAMLVEPLQNRYDALLRGQDERLRVENETLREDILQSCDVPALDGILPEVVITIVSLSPIPQPRCRLGAAV